MQVIRMFRELKFFNKFLKPAFAKPMLAAALFIAKINFSSSFLRFFLRIFLNFRKFKNYSKLSVFRFRIFSYIIHAVSRSKTLFYFQFFLDVFMPISNFQFAFYFWFSTFYIILFTPISKVEISLLFPFQHFQLYYSRRFSVTNYVSIFPCIQKNTFYFWTWFLEYLNLIFGVLSNRILVNVAANGDGLAKAE